jgi:hypothetical protein
VSSSIGQLTDDTPEQGGSAPHPSQRGLFKKLEESVARVDLRRNYERTKQPVD